MTRYPVRLLSTLPRLLLALLLLWCVSPALADNAADRLAIDKLFAELRVAPDAKTAHAIDQQIWTYWTSPPSDPILAGRMHEALVARNTGDTATAMRLLDQLVAEYPDYAEAWNQRATMYYIMGDFEASIVDCEKVLAIEPRHFGALSGRALMYLQMGKRALALRDMAAALAVHPFLNERRLFPELGEPMTQI
ncbi:MAG: tetratricopeptide repeat protein [Devosia sp.]|uniref:tetratricopeptide repeat protein n=1 Tax=Devosia sp. TaxID=1871048 RepID=UPI00261354FA|nr:tetratricopeptide repeat protein [Devosia sp.]MDB5539965.1 tetratricopeptide repeat protein [Devosia sp.]